MESDDAAKSEKGSLLYVYSTQPDKLKKTESGRIASGVVKKRETSVKDEPVYMASDDTEKSEKVSVLTLYHTKTHKVHKHDIFVCIIRTRQCRYNYRTTQCSCKH